MHVLKTTLNKNQLTTNRNPFQHSLLQCKIDLILVLIPKFVDGVDQNVRFGFVLTDLQLQVGQLLRWPISFVNWSDLQEPISMVVFQNLISHGFAENIGKITFIQVHRWCFTTKIYLSLIFMNTAVQSLALFLLRQKVTFSQFTKPNWSSRKGHLILKFY